MDDIFPELISAILGAFIALLLRELFAWKGQGRNEAITRYETLLIECYGKLQPLLEAISIEGNCLMFPSQYKQMNEIYCRFAFRMPENIDLRLKSLLYTDDPIGTFIQGSEDHAFDFKFKLMDDIQKMINDLAKEIEKLESYVQSIRGRIKYIFGVWNFSEQNLMKTQNKSKKNKNDNK